MSPTQSAPVSAIQWPETDPLLGHVWKGISSERLRPYARAGGGALAPLARYRWNVRLSEACYPVLSAIEVALRNSLFDAIAVAHPTGPWGLLPCWLDRHPPLLALSEQDRVTRAVQVLRHRGQLLQPGRVVAELTFGFWTSLLDVRYEHRQRFWPTLLSDVFPYMPRAQRTRRMVSARLQRIRYLRNRVFHHEPIWHWRDLREQHAQMTEVLGWLNPDLMCFVGTSDRFPAVYAGGWERYQTGVLG